VDSETVSKVERAEIVSPSPRKILTDRTIHLSYAMPTSYDPPVITDFGAARLGDPGQKHRGDVMPGVFRAPEIIAAMEWDSKIDISSFGVMVRFRADVKHSILANALMKIWNLLEDGNLFNPFKDGRLNDELHFAQMVSLMGPPPKQFLERSDRCGRYWDTDGTSTSGHGSVCPSLTSI
jgi:hypothetical protein